MKLKFKQQVYQTLAAEAVVDCFKGQPHTSGINYRIDLDMKYKDSKGYSQAVLQEEAGLICIYDESVGAKARKYIPTWARS